MGRKLTIIGYHSVNRTPFFRAASGGGGAGFRQQLHTLRRIATIVPLSSAISAMQSGDALPSRAVALTFDDGYADNLEVAAPLLEEFEAPATFYLVPAFLSGELDAWWELLAWAFQHREASTVEWEGQSWLLDAPSARDALKNQVDERMKDVRVEAREALIRDFVERLAPHAPPLPRTLFMDWSDARKLARRGFEIGSHSSQHAILANEEPDVQLADLGRAKRVLEGELQTSVASLAYPNGTDSSFSTDTCRAVEHVGYKSALTTIPGRNDATVSPYELRRIMAVPSDGARGLLRSLAGTYKSEIRSRVSA